MRTFLRVLFLIAFVSLSVNVVRLVYERWLEPTESVLDKFDSPSQTLTRQASNLAELESRYAVAHSEAAALREELKSSNQDLGDWAEHEPLKLESELRAAVLAWEEQSFEIRKVRVFWSAGVLFLVLGWVAHRRSEEWLATACLVVAFGEMIFWTSVPYFSARSEEVERLMMNKMFLAGASLGMLLLTAWTLKLVASKEGSAPKVG